MLPCKPANNALKSIPVPSADVIAVWSRAVYAAAGLPYPPAKSQDAVAATGSPTSKEAGQSYAPTQNPT